MGGGDVRLTSAVVSRQFASAKISRDVFDQDRDIGSDYMIGKISLPLVSVLAYEDWQTPLIDFVRGDSHTSDRSGSDGLVTDM